MSNRDLAIPELAAVRVNGMSRSAFILRSALAAGAVYGAAAVTPYVRGALAQEGEEAARGDVDILNLALTLERLETAFYEQALTDVPGLGGDLRALTAELRNNEAEHVKALVGLVRDAGGQPVEETSFEFLTAFSNRGSYLTVAQTLEETGVSAYNGAGSEILDKKVLAAAGSIVQVEGRHAALIRKARGEPPAPTAFDESLERDAVLRAIEPFRL